MTMRALPVNHAMLHEKDDPTVYSCEWDQSRASKFFQHERPDRDERNEQECKCELKP